MAGFPHAPSLINWLLILASMLSVELAGAAVRCERNLVANVVAFDQPLMFNRLGAQNINGMMFALRRDVVDEHEQSLAYGGAAVPGKVSLRPDKRPRPLVLRVAAGDCLTINLQNLLDYQANPTSTLKTRAKRRARKTPTAPKTSKSTNKWRIVTSVSRSTACKR